jgi:protein phosphatase
VSVDLHTFEAEPGDLYLLCSDGLSGVVRDAEIAEIVGREPPREAVRILVDLVNARSGPDNVTVQIVHLPPADAEAAPVCGRDERRRQIRALSIAVAVVAALLAIVLLVGLASELRP